MTAFESCSECEAKINTSLRSCPHCGTATGWSGGASPSRTSGVSAERFVRGDDDRPSGLDGPAVATDQLLRDPGRKLTMEDYRSPVGRARLLRIALLAWVALAGVLMAYLSELGDVVDRLSEAPLTVFAGDLVETAEAVDRAAAIGAAGLIVVGLIFMMWMWRIYGNLTVLGARRLRYGRGWVVGAWFVPFINLVRPKRMLDDAWMVSGPAAPSLVELPDPTLRRPTLSTWWWSLWILYGVLAAFLPARILDVGDMGSVAQTELVRQGLLAISAILLFRLTTALTLRQTRRAALLGITDEVPPSWATAPRADESWSWPRTARLAVPVVVLVVFGALGSITLETSLRGSVEASQPGRLVSDLIEGDCFDEPPLGGGWLAVPIVDCREPHDYETLRWVHHSPSATYPGEDRVFQDAIDICAPRLESLLGLPMEESGLDILVLYPLEQHWRVGDTASLCMVTTLDGSKLERRIVRSR